MKIKFVILGSGWRSEFYTRISLMLPEQFELAAIWTLKEEEVQAFQQRYPVFVTTNLERILEQQVDFAVVCMPSHVARQYSLKLLERGIPVLMETPPALTAEELNVFWSQCRQAGGKIQVAEVYHRQPYLATVVALAEQGVLGVPQTLTMSMMHGYHCFGLTRRLLGVGFEPASIMATHRECPIRQTCEKGRGLISGGQKKIYETDEAIVTFSSGKTLVYHYSKEQYFSTLRFRWLCLEGSEGALMGDMVYTYSPSQDFVRGALQRVDFGSHGSLIGNFHCGYQYQGQWIYKNPLQGYALTDDEIAVATGLQAMKHFVETGQQSYSLEDACQDAYLSLLIDEAARTGKTVHTLPNRWCADQASSGK